MLDILIRGGVMMIPLLLCSVVAVAIIVERWINLRNKKIIRPEIVDIIENIKGIMNRFGSISPKPIWDPKNPMMKFSLICRISYL